MRDIKKVMISSTLCDLPIHRQVVKNACLRQGKFPIMMDHLPAKDDNAITASIKMVDEADIYLGIFANRYGHIPPGQNISITEMEFNHAVYRGIPVLIFIMHQEHPILAEDIEIGNGFQKIINFKEMLKNKYVVNFFKSPDELGALVINSLSMHSRR